MYIQKGKKIYITLNIIPHNDDLIGLEDYVKFLVDIGVDALIVADAGVYTAVRSVVKTLKFLMVRRRVLQITEQLNFGAI